MMCRAVDAQCYTNITCYECVMCTYVYTCTRLILIPRRPRIGRTRVSFLCKLVIIIILCCFASVSRALSQSGEGDAGHDTEARVFYIGMQRCLEMAMMDSLLYTSVRI